MNANEFTGSDTGLHNLTFHIACLTDMKLLAQTERGYTVSDTTVDMHVPIRRHAHSQTHARECK